MAVIDRVLVGEALVIENRADGSGLDLLNVAHIDLLMDHVVVQLNKRFVVR